MMELVFNFISVPSSGLGLCENLLRRKFFQEPFHENTCASNIMQWHDSATGSPLADQHGHR